VVAEDKASTSFTVITVEEIAEALAEERRGIVDDRGGAFIKTNTLAVMEVGLVTILGRTGLTTSVRDVGLVIILSPVVAKTGSIGEATGISPIDLAWSVIGSVTIISSATLESPAGSAW